MTPAMFAMGPVQRLAKHGPTTAAPPMLSAGGLYDRKPVRTRDAGELGGDVVVDSLDAAEVEAAKRRSIARGVATIQALGSRGRSAGDIRAGTASGVPPGMDAGRWASMDAAERDAWFEARGSGGSSNASEVFDPTDPAAMTETRWRGMSTDERRDWINANVRDTEQRNRMVASIATGVFDTVRDFVRTERETRLAEIREANATQREGIRADADTERARIAAETERLRIQADTARQEAARAQAEATRAAADAARATTEADRARADAEATAARERAAVAQAAADNAARARATAEAEAARARSVELATGNGGDAPAVPVWVKVAGGGVVLLLVGLAGKALLDRQAPPQFPAGRVAQPVQFGGYQ